MFFACRKFNVKSREYNKLANLLKDSDAKLRVCVCTSIYDCQLQRAPAVCSRSVLIQRRRVGVFFVCRKLDYHAAVLFLALLAGRLQGRRVGAVFFQKSLIPYFVLELCYAGVQILTFCGYYGFVPYAP